MTSHPRLARQTPAAHTRVGLNTPQIELLAIWVGGMHCVIVTKLWGTQIFGVGGFKHPYDKIVPTNNMRACANCPGHDRDDGMVGYEYAKELAVCVERWWRTGSNAE